jgi:hypothetical protein
VDDVVWGQHEPTGFSPSGLTRTFVDATARALRGMDCGDLTQARDWTNRGDERVVLPADRAYEVDAAAIARWIAAQYPGPAYPGVVIGTRHGSAAHLAAAMGVPWLPSGFDLDVRWPDGCATDGAAAMAYGAAVATRILDGNRGVAVRQVHDPVRMSDAAGCRVHLNIRWQWLPIQLRSFLDSQVRPGGFALVVRDVGSWPVLDTGDGFSCQVGSSTTGLNLATYANGPDLSNLMRRTGSVATWPTGRYRRFGVEYGVEPGIEAGVRQWAEDREGRVFSILYHGAEALSAAVADIYREWLRDQGKTGNRLVVSAGRLLDPWQTIRAGLVPYWCGTSTRAGVAAAELWMAGSPPFSSVDVLPEPPGATWSQVAPLAQWSVLTQFASRRGVVSPAVARAYPLRPLAPRHATEALRALPYDLPALDPLGVDAAVARLRSNGPGNGILVSYGAGADGPRGED